MFLPSPRHPGSRGLLVEQRLVPQQGKEHTDTTSRKSKHPAVLHALFGVFIAAAATFNLL
jgi:hypothetical protein